MNQKVLEVLIPTYRRPKAAIGAIDSVLSTADPRVGVFCHSNGVETELEAAAAQRPALRYACFLENRGAVANFRKILEDSRADYVLLLSDEDRVDPKQLEQFVNFLSIDRHGFVFCNVIESTGANYFSVAALGCESLSLDDVLVLFPIDPTYMSGYCFRRDLLTDEVIRDTFEDNEANVYPHLMLRNVIASRASVGLFAPGIVVKGSEANTGGDSHAHVEQTGSMSLSLTAHRQPLNPGIYSAGARARQFYYLVPRFCRVLAQVSRFRRAYAKLYIMSAWLKITTNAHLHVDPMAAVATLEATIGEHQNQVTCASGLVITYNNILSIRQPALRTAFVNLLWYSSKFVKLMLFFQRFGVLRTLAYVKGKHG